MSMGKIIDPTENYAELKVAVLIASYNRKKFTLRILEQIFSMKPINWTLNVHLCDDGSSDGTSGDVAELFPQVKIVQGDGNWYWAKSMYMAERSIDETFDYVLWLNDDISILEGTFESLIASIKLEPKAIFVGQMASTDFSKVTYGGLVKKSRHPLNFRPMNFSKVHQRIDTFNGNFVFIPKHACDLIGRIEGRFRHTLADIDYGLRASKCGIPVFTLPGFIATCESVMVRPSPQGLRELIAWYRDPKCGNFSSQLKFLKRHTKFGWILYIFYSNFTFIFKAILKRKKGSQSSDY
jgi:GT2 family glycosyltransferase